MYRIRRRLHRRPVLDKARHTEEHRRVLGSGPAKRAGLSRSADQQHLA